MNCVIDFDDNPQGVFYSGQTISGKVTITCYKLKKFKKLLVEIKGHGSTSFEMTSSGEHANQRGKIIVFGPGTICKGHEEYMESKKVLLQGENDKGVLLEPGTYTYNFSELIPEDCPSSFEAWHGKNRYQVEVIFVKHWKYNETFRKYFTVIKNFDLNSDERPSIRLPSFRENTTNIKLFKNDPCTIKVFLPQKGFVPGQEVPLLYLVDNRTGATLKETRVRLNILVTYYSFKPKFERNEKYVLTVIKGPGVGPQTRKYFSCSLKVPPTLPSCYTRSNLIHIEYEIEVEVRPPTWYKKANVRIPIVIGTLPLTKQTSLEQREHKLPTYEDLFKEEKNQRESRPLLSLLDLVAILPPPVYEDAVQYMKDGEDPNETQEYGSKIFGGRKYIPKYPLYKVSSPSPLTIEEVESIFPSTSSST